MRRVFGQTRCPPNERSEHQTAATILADWHYSKLQIIERWDWNRFARLCRFLNLTPYELASVVAMNHSAVEPYRATNQIPGNNPRPLAILLTLLEARVLAEYSTDVVENVFPDLSATATGGLQPA